jgi:NAD(P)-dependent dehydrogenase (short-subunit alcohol dehydrogenase family)
MITPMRLAGKKALVTGGASGIGRAVVTAFRAEGAEVVAADIAGPAASTSGDERSETVYLDVSQERDWERLAERICPLDLLVACAGIADAKPIPETSLDDWRRVMAVNLDGAFLSLKYGAKVMPAGGAIVLVGSASGVKASPGASAYCASKAGLRMLARTAALEFKPRAIRVNCVSPAAVVTPMWQKMPFWSDLVDKHGSEQAAWAALGGADPATPSIQRMAFPEEIAAAIVFLSCDESAHITGADLLVDGGHCV